MVAPTIAYVDMVDVTVSILVFVPATSVGSKVQIMFAM